MNKFYIGNIGEEGVRTFARREKDSNIGFGTFTPKHKYKSQLETYFVVAGRKMSAGIELRRKYFNRLLLMALRNHEITESEMAAYRERHENLEKISRR